MNSAIRVPVVEIMGIASTHFVKYSVAVMMNLCPPEDVGVICPIRSNAHLENGQSDCIGCSS